ncbi:MAG: AIR synthase-related protein [Sulfolobaceae archaeon]
MDLEGIARRIISNNGNVKEKIKEFINFYKKDNQIYSEKFIDALLVEVRNSLKANSMVFTYPNTGLRAGEVGLGSRGVGDNVIHEALFRISNRNLDTFDDAGFKENVVVSIDGIHSRLSYFPYLAGFHATKATLRDIMVKGAEPLGVLVDIHLSDDSDIGMLLDFEAGVSTVTDALGISILAGSTLRIGGDLVIGERISGAVGSVGIVRGKFLSRSNIELGDKIVMTEGNGGGTITTTAIYNGMPEIVLETISIKELIACKTLLRIKNKINSMTDVTNGGIRLDALEIQKIKKYSLIIDEEKFLSLINPKVRKMLDELNIDPYGISIDSILIFTKNEKEVLQLLESNGIRAAVIGEVTEFKDAPILLSNGKPLQPRFRESPYTPIKKVIGNYSPYSLEEIRDRLENGVKYVINKKMEILKNLKGG